MTPGQLDVIARMHRIANDPDAPPLAPETTGDATAGISDIAMLAAMTRL